MGTGYDWRVPFFICPNCKDRSIDNDGAESLHDQQAVSCRRCGFGFLFELMEDYYPAPGTGLIACDAAGRILAAGRGVLERTGYGDADLIHFRRVLETLQRVHKKRLLPEHDKLLGSASAHS